MSLGLELVEGLNALYGREVLSDEGHQHYQPADSYHISLHGRRMAWVNVHDNVIVLDGEYDNDWNIEDMDDLAYLFDNLEVYGILTPQDQTET